MHDAADEWWCQRGGVWDALVPWIADVMPVQLRCAIITCPAHVVLVFDTSPATQHPKHHVPYLYLFESIDNESQFTMLLCKSNSAQ